MKAGDIELNPGPPKINTRQTTLTSSPLSRTPSNYETDIVEAVKNMTHRFDKLEERINRRLESFEIMLNKLAVDSSRNTDNIQKLEKQVNEMSNRILEMEEQQKKNVIHVDKIEGQSRRKNLIFHCVTESEKETWEQTEDKVQRIIKEKLKIEGVSFERVHRLDTKIRPRPVIAKFTSFKQRSNVLQERKNLRGTDIFVNEDFTHRVREIRRNLQSFVKTFKEAGRRVNIVYDHLIVDGIRHDWDADTKTCVARGRVNRSQPASAASTAFNINNEGWQLSQLSQSQQSSQQWLQNSRNHNSTE